MNRNIFRNKRGMKKIGMYLFFSLMLTRVAAQDLLTLDNAIKIALKNNYSISISKNDAQVAENNATYGNAGAYPLTQIVAGENFQNNAIHQQYSTGAEVIRPSVKSYTTTAGAQLTWTIFQGFKMYATYDRLKELEKIGEANLRMTIENNIAQVINAFYDIAQQKQQMKATNQNISLYEEKLEIARKKLEIGSSSKLDFLQAKVDLNAQKSKFLSLKISMVTAKATLNQLLARPSDVDFDIEDTIVINYNPSIEELRKSALEQNTQLSIAEKNMQVANAVIRENESLLYPTIYFTPGYNFSLVKNQAGLVLLNQGLGFNAGGNLVYNIFNGSYATRNIQNAKISSYTSKLNYDFTKLQVETSVNKTFETFQNNLQLLKLEEDNTAIVNENVYVAFERFKIGSSSGIELKQAQQSLEDAQYRLINARFTTKLAETELLRLNGSLYKLLK